MPQFHPESELSAGGREESLPVAGHMTHMVCVTHSEVRVAMYVLIWRPRLTLAAAKVKTAAETAAQVTASHGSTHYKQGLKSGLYTL